MFHGIKLPAPTAENITAIVLLFVVIVSGAILFMCLVGMITFADPLIKEAWIEINSQILNAVFTLQALMVQPIRAKLAYWTIRLFSSKTDQAVKQEMRNRIYENCPPIYLANHERDVPADAPISSKATWIAMLGLLNGQCIFQYPITVAMWAWAANPNNRPKWIVPLFLPLSFLSGAGSGLWLHLMNRKIQADALRTSGEQIPMA